MIVAEYDYLQEGFVLNHTFAWFELVVVFLEKNERKHDLDNLNRNVQWYFCHVSSETISKLCKFGEKYRVNSLKT